MKRRWQKALAWLMAPWLMAQSAPPASTQTAILQIRVVDGEGAIHAIGSKAARGLTVEVTDETGKPVGGAAVSFRLPEEGPSGVFANGMRTEVVISAPDGRATVWGIQWNRQEGPFQVRITAAKGQARAGTTASQYLSATAPKPDGSVVILPGSGQARSSHRKWLLIAAVAVAAVAGGGLAASMGRSSTSSTTTSSTDTVTIGSPTVTIGKP